MFLKYCFNAPFKDVMPGGSKEIYKLLEGAKIHEFLELAFESESVKH